MESLSNLAIDAIAALKLGGVIAYPTEAVYGLGCDPDNELAIKKLLALKSRELNKGLILVAANLEQLLPYVACPKTSWPKHVLASWPGPITWVMPAEKNLTTSTLLQGDFDKQAVRVSAHPTIQALCLAFGKPIVSTSANLQGQSPAKSKAEVLSIFGGHIDGIVDGSLSGQLTPTEIRDATNLAIIRK